MTFLRKVFFILSTFFVLIFLPDVNGQFTHKPRFSEGIDLSPDAASERWGQFASSRLGGDYAMAFDLTHRPLRGEDVKYKGYMLGAEFGGAVYTRIYVAPLAAIENGETFILKNSPSGSAVWKFENGKFVELKKQDWQKPLIKGLLYSPFDLLMPYKHWQAKYAGAGRVGQAVHNFDLENSAFARQKVRVSLTRDFNAPAQIQIFENSVLKKTARLGSVKKVDGLWIMREASVKDNSTRNNDVLRFTHAKFKIALPKEIFAPTSSKEIKIPSMQKL